MLKISSKEIREIFLKFFESKDHLRIEGSSVIPSSDPTLLFINSGMAPLKKYFTSEAQPPHPTLCNIQPCIRTIDIEEIGDRHHLTSFEMLGSWSINCYFKENAIALAYQLLTEGFKIPKEKLFVTVFSGSEKLNLEPDNESAAIWEKAGIDKNHIVYQSFEDNFWGPTAETGPCGPCTEVFYDTGEDFGGAYIPGGNFDTKSRYIEIWNAGVFMQFNKDKNGNYEPLKIKSVDTGAGLERLAMALNGLNSVYETDLLKPIMDEVFSQSKGNFSGKAIRIITDHMRTTTFILSEGVKPSNDGRGYIPRRLIRKCVALITKAKLDKFDFTKILDIIIELYGDFYKHFKENKEKIVEIFEAERTHFQQVLKDGFFRLEKLSEVPGFKMSGNEAFTLAATYGIPIDLISEYVEEKGGSLDIDAFKDEFKKHQEISRNVSSKTNGDFLKFNINEYSELLKLLPATDFTGYNFDSCQVNILQIMRDGQTAEYAKAGDMILIVTDKTPFYSESGGQVSDTGILETPESAVNITGVQKSDGRFIHMGTVKSGTIKSNIQAEISIDKKRRRKIECNHSSVHLLQAALRQILGGRIRQAGSLVDEDRLRFDFSCDEKLTEEQIELTEKLVNNYIRKNVPLTTKTSTLQEAVNSGVLAFFEEKYGDKVRIVQFDDISKELCGGTHTSSTGNIGFFKIIAEGSIGRGIRRITAITGEAAVSHVQDQLKLLKSAAAKLKVPPDEILNKLDSMSQSSKAEKNTALSPASKDDIQKEAKRSKKGRAFLVKKFDMFSNDIRDEAVRASEIINGTVCFICSDEGKIKVIVAVNKAISKEINANAVLQKTLIYIDGKGGGKPHLALGGGAKTDGVNKIIENFSEIVDELVT